MPGSASVGKKRRDLQASSLLLQRECCVAAYNYVLSYAQIAKGPPNVPPPSSSPPSHSQLSTIFQWVATPHRQQHVRMSSPDHAHQCFPEGRPLPTDYEVYRLLGSHHLGG